MPELSDHDVVIVEAVRAPLGRRNGALATVHPADLLGLVQRAAIERSGVDPREVGQVIGGCVSQVGEQTFNIARTAWLSAGLPLEVAGTTVDSQCGSSQQAANLATAMVASGVVDVALACGIGTAIERYDFFIYGTAAAVVFGTQFFPQVSELVGRLAAFATFAMGFFALPLGGIVMGHFGEICHARRTLAAPGGIGRADRSVEPYAGEVRADGALPGCRCSRPSRAKRRRPGGA